MKTLSIAASLFLLLLGSRACEPSARDTPREAVATAAPRYLHLTLEVTQAGTARVIGAAEISGVATLSDASIGPFLWRVSRDGEALAVGSLPDPFEIRGTGASGAPNESRNLGASGTVTMQVPDLGLDGSLETLRAEIFRLRPAADGSALQRVDAPTVARLEREERLEPVARLGGSDLAAQIRRVGKKAP